MPFLRAPLCASWFNCFSAARLRLPERATAVALLLVLHAALFFLISPDFGVQEETRPLREITLSLPAPQLRTLPPPPINPVLVKPNAPEVTPPIILETNVPRLSAPAAPNVTGLGQSLFNCDLANSRNLSREQRANCLNFALAPPAAGTVEAGLPKNSRAKQNARWAAALAARQKPVSVPCTGIAQMVLGGPGVQKQVTIPVADPLCLLNGVWNGFRPESK